MADTQDATMLELLDYLEGLILREFGDDVQQVYKGDVGIYPPSAFRDGVGNHKLAVMIDIRDLGEADDDTRSAAGEVRPLRIDLVPMLNMVPFFEAMPTAAYGETMMLRFVERVVSWFRRTENITWDGHVTTSKVRGVELDFFQRGELSIRAAAIHLEVKLYFDNW